MSEIRDPPPAAPRGPFSTLIKSLMDSPAEKPPHRHFFLDTEFMESGANGRGEIDLISIGIVDEEGRTFYAINKDADFTRANTFVRDEVMSKLPPRNDPAWMTPAQIAGDVLRFLMPDNREPHIWTWYGAYDHVVFCWLFGPMVDLPDGLAMFARDLKFMLPFLEAASGEEIVSPPKPEDAHNALADAQWLREYWANVERACAGLEWFERL